MRKRYQSTDQFATLKTISQLSENQKYSIYQMVWQKLRKIANFFKVHTCISAYYIKFKNQKQCRKKKEKGKNRTKMDSINLKGFLKWQIRRKDKRNSITWGFDACRTLHFQNSNKQKTPQNNKKEDTGSYSQSDNNLLSTHSWNVWFWEVGVGRLLGERRL